MNLPLSVKPFGAGTLALVGSGEYLPGVDAIDRLLLARLPEPARVVCLPTAAGTEGEERITYWSNLGRQHFERLGVVSVEALPIIDQASASDESMAERIRASNFVYLSGGKPQYLYLSLEGTPVLAAILEVLQAGGVVAGCSAGAMIFGERIPGSPFPWSWADGFGLLPGTLILPHFDELPKAVLAGFSPFASQWTIIGIEGNTALVCSASECFVAGTDGVTIIKSNHKLRYTADSI